MNLGQNIAQLRNNAGMTQEALAEMCEVSRQAVTKWESGASEPTIDKLILLANIFDVSIDEIVKAKNVTSAKIQNQFSKEELRLVELSIHMINECGFLNSRYGGRAKYELLRWLYKLVKNKFVDVNGNIIEKYLVCNTSKEDREIDTVTLGGCIFEECNLMNDYIQGKCEIDEAFERIDIEIEKRIGAANEFYNIKKESEIVKKHNMLFAKSGIEDFSNYSESYCERLGANVSNLLSEISDKTMTERLLIFFAKEIETAIKNRDETATMEIWKDLLLLEDYFWYKA